MSKTKHKQQALTGYKFSLSGHMSTRHSALNHMPSQITLQTDFFIYDFKHWFI